MTREDAITHFGTVKALASALGITHQAVYDWGEEIPEGRQWQIQAITKGKLKVASKKPKDKAS